MTDSVDRSSPIPYYIQVWDILRENIQNGIWQPGEQIPGEPELCRTFGVSRTVIRQALNEMVHKGLIVREKGKGTFVATPKISESLVGQLTGFHQDMVEQGYNPVAHVLRQNIVPASSKVATYLNVEVGSQIIEIERLRFIGELPIQLVTTYIPYALCPDLATADFSQQSLYAFLEQQCGIMIARGRRSIEAVPANEYEARHLNVKKGAPLILLDSVSYMDDGTPVEYYHAVHRGDRAKFEVELVRVRKMEAHDDTPHERRGVPWGGGLVVRRQSESD
ncbi:MAG TPA: GntR family transcriptional regulator [Aggregatilinea sp.]|uniref:GntR family transcriptional regulator n=1 Tax=Aggregatilinea sp. TaxID=2806333 RepID=UPI002C2D04EF|nr:GntR family transcriptional regulator [Aggregatilinea sp.]HML20365.1 GntR family transcriptional regulator [Aggregatilinea sp.]